MLNQSAASLGIPNEAHSRRLGISRSMRPGWSQGWRAHPPHEGRRVAVELRRRDGVRIVLCHVTGRKGVMPTLGSNALGTLHKGRLAIGTEVRLSAAAIPGAQVASGQGVAVLVANSGAGRLPKVLERCSTWSAPPRRQARARAGDWAGLGWRAAIGWAGPDRNPIQAGRGRLLQWPRPACAEAANALLLLPWTVLRAIGQRIPHEDPGLYAPADRRRALGSGRRQAANAAPALPRLTEYQAWRRCW